MKKYDVLVFIGRFQPFHNGHKAIIDRALELSKEVLILTGSSNRPRSLRNPFTFEERRDMILGSYTPDFEKDSVLQARQKRIVVRPINDIMYNDDRWIEQVQRIVTNEVVKMINSDTPNAGLHGLNDAKIGLIGCAKDHTSYYLNLFPTWASETVYKFPDLDSTSVRDEFFETGVIPYDTVPEYVQTWLETWGESKEYENLLTEAQFVRGYQESVKKYPRIEHTVDAVVIQSGHILLIRRRSEPGKGMWALPGGFLNLTEKLKDGAIRELREETKIKVPTAVLRGSIVKEKTYDDPHRSDRARIITQAFLFKLTDGPLPRVKGSDDADKAAWVPLSQISADSLFEDHYFIVQDMIGDL